MTFPLGGGHPHRSNIMFQCNSQYRCCACTAAVFEVVVQFPPPSLRDPPPLPWWGGTVTTVGEITSGG